MADPRAEYGSRLQARREAVARETASEDRWSTLRLVAFLGLAVLGFLKLRGVAFPIFLWALPPAAFLWCWAQHHQTKTRLGRARRALDYYERGIARLEHRWVGTGKQGLTYADPHHPFALDLDLFGEGSLFERLCTAHTSVGEQLLAHWLCKPAHAEEIRSRQAAIRELQDKVDWREELALLGDEVNSTLEMHELLRWAAAEGEKFPAWAAPLALALTFAMLAGLALWFLGHGALLLAVAALGEGLFYWRFHQGIARVARAIGTPAAELDQLARLLALFENGEWRSEGLVSLKGTLRAEGLLPSAQIARLRRLVEWLDSRRNQFFAPIAALLMWETHLAFRLEDWRRTMGPFVAGWLSAAARLEALSALAAYTFENPEDVFATFVDEKGAYRAQALGHPLLPREAFVTNDVSLGADTRLLLVSGSNMSGKSTLLRSIGINAVLAQAGAPVRAKKLELSELNIGATLRVQDDLRKGASRFYAELLRLRLVTELTADARPVLFLLDEILHGTNSHDRVTGAQAILRGLVRRGAFGAVTTHDLALTQLAQDKDVRAKNVFFADHFEGGQMRFDYRMREGVITHSNALELMRSVGLDVETPPRA